MEKQISIVMSTYNECEQDLKKSIDSMLSQTFSNFEFIIILDNPQNNVHKKILSEYEKNDDRIRLFFNPENIGLAASLNKGIHLANSKYIARMDADDISVPTRLEKEFSFLEKHPNIDIISSNKIDIDEIDQIINIPSSLPKEDKEIKKLLEIGSVICHSAAMFKREAILSIGGYRLFPASQDYDLWLRASDHNLKFAIIDEPLIKYRIRSNNISNSNPLKQYLLKEYIQYLHAERKKNGEDSFSIVKLEEFLSNNKAFDEKEILKFKKSIKHLEYLKASIKEKKYLKALWESMFTLFSQKHSKDLLVSSIKSYVLKGKSNV